MSLVGGPQGDRGAVEANSGPFHLAKADRFTRIPDLGGWK
jgi:hypothetical protein